MAVIRGAADTGSVGTENCDVSSADYVPANKNCQGISCDVSGYVKYDQTTPGIGTSTCVRLLAPAEIYPIENVTKVYHAVTNCTFSPDGSTQIAGIRLEL